MEASNEDKIATAISKLNSDDQARHKTALTEGYKDEVCGGCGAVFLAFHHMVRCNKAKCPMRSQKDPRSILEMVLGDKKK